ncbi:unnamed protein product [Phytomonas sp. Hart1]|nr:unnamed protein product [Phytomonas sp. Hart1]|eukprot:CCW72004.1 unnamed protein product [Phytomonas sp. isolate Hart1]
MLFPGGSMVQKFKRFDVFPKFDRKFEVDARHRTISGGIFSIVSLVIILMLIISETRYFLSSKTTQDMLVDPTVGGEMPIILNLTFHRVSCDLIVINSIDALGSHMDHIVTKTVKTRVNPDTLRPLGEENPIIENTLVSKTLDQDSAKISKCPSCHGAELYKGHCCFTCDDVRNAYEQRGWKFSTEKNQIEQCAEERQRLASALLANEGCNIYTKLSVARVTGILQFILGELHTHSGIPHIDIGSDSFRNLNLSHVIHQLEFGEAFPGQINPLTGVEQIRGRDLDTNAKRFMNGRFSYFVKVVPTRYKTTSLLLSTSTTTDSSQYSVTHHFTPSLGKMDGEKKETGRPAPPTGVIPGVFITYDLSPIKVHIVRSHPYPSFAHFILQLCAVCGGVFTVGGLIDAMLYHTVRRLKKHSEGKLM